MIVNCKEQLTSYRLKTNLCFTQADLMLILVALTIASSFNLLLLSYATKELSLRYAGCYHQVTAMIEVLTENDRASIVTTEVITIDN